MIPANLLPIANHLWQSTLFTALAALLALALRRNRASIRYWLWLAASLKFLVPFSLLVALGSRFEWRGTPVAAPLSSAMAQITQPFAIPLMAPIDIPVASHLAPALLGVVWFAGCAVVLALWCARWRRMLAVRRAALPMPIHAALPVMSSHTLLEPGVFGIFRPVLLLPEGIADRLTPMQLRAVLVHEFCHVRRRDNLSAALHMAVEALFWFHPLVWWIGARLIEERERACDEEVLRQGSDPEAYAAGILNVCQFYLESPLACASGVTGADLKKRIEAIMTSRRLATMTVPRRLLLATAGIAAVAGPVAVGILHPPRTHAQSLKFEVASVKPADRDTRGMGFGRTPGGGLKANGVNLRTLIEFAYDVRSFQISGGPGWIESERYEVLASPDRPEGPADLATATRAEQKQVSEHLRERTRALLADRFHLSVHRESKELPAYALVLAKGGHKLEKATETGGISRDRGRITGKSATSESLAMVLSFVLGRPVFDRTGLTEEYAFDLAWSEESDVRQIAKDKGLPIPADAHPPDAAPSDPSGPSIFTAIEKQLGLKLESAKGPVEIIVIDRAEKPTAN